MASEPKGYIRVPVWVDDGVVKSLVNDDGRVPIVLELSDVTLDVNIESSDINVPVTESSPLTSIQSQLYGWDLNYWRKNPIVYGFTDRISLNVNHTKVGVGDYTLDIMTVLDGYVYIVQVINSRNRDTIVDQAHVIYDGTNNYYIENFDTVPVGEFSISNDRYYVLKKDDIVRALFFGCANNDRLQGRAWGYSMKVNE